MSRPATASAHLRIGTWNLEGKWSSLHERLLLELDCEVWLLTEVRRDATLGGYDAHLTTADMATGRAWAAILTRGSAEPLPDPHPASALVQWHGYSLCSSILPWKGSGPRPPWTGASHANAPGCHR